MPEATQTVTTTESVLPPIPPDAHLVPPEKDPYFRRRDGTAVTGEAAKSNGKPTPPRANDGKFTKAEGAEAKQEPAKAQDKPAETPAEEPTQTAEPEPEAKPETDPEEKPKTEAEAKKEAEERTQRIGDAWREVKAQRKELQRAAAEIQQARQQQLEHDRAIAEARAQIEADRKAVQDELSEIKADFRGYLRKHGLSFRELVEADLTEEETRKAADPHEKELAEIKRIAAEAAAEAKALREQIEAKRKAEEEERAEQVAAQERQAEIVELHTVIQANSEEFPHLAVYKPAAQELRDAFYANQGRLDWRTLLEQAEKILADQDDAFASLRKGKQAAEEPATAARAVSRNGSRVAEEPEEKPTAITQAAPSTLTNRTAAQRQSAQTPAVKLSPEERKKRIALTTLKYRGD